MSDFHSIVFVVQGVYRGIVPQEDTHASCEYNGVYGKVKSEWRRENRKTIYTITVPSNATVEAVLLDGEHILKSRTYVICI